MTGAIRASRRPCWQWISSRPTATPSKRLPPAETPTEIIHALFRGLTVDDEKLAGTCLIEVTPEKEFVTYGVGIPLMQMRYPEKARGRAPVGGRVESLQHDERKDYA